MCGMETPPPSSTSTSTPLDRELARAVVAAMRDDADLLAELRALLDVEPRVDERRTWLTLAEAGERLGVSPDAVRMRAKRGRLEVRHHGRRVYVSAASVDRLA